LDRRSPRPHDVGATSLNGAPRVDLITEAVAELFTSLIPDGTATRIWWIALLLLIVILLFVR
jgi:hypothetical protein